MKLFSAFIFLCLLSQGAYAFSNCLKGTLKLTNTKEYSVLIILGEKSRNLQYVDLFRIDGLLDSRYSGDYTNSSTLQFNYNDDYIPGGNATYNIDIELVRGDDEVVIGTYKEYRFPYGSGGYGESDSSTLLKKGNFQLKSCNL